MPQIRTILCAVDFSPPSEAAFAYARELAAKLDAQIHLLHVYQLPIYALPDGAVMMTADYTAKLANELQKELHKLAAEERVVPVRTQLVEGLPYREIGRIAKELPADLIVVGTHGRTGVKHLLLGSVAERVVRTSPVPVITVPTHER